MRCAVLRLLDQYVNHLRWLVGWNDRRVTNGFPQGRIRCVRVCSCMLVDAVVWIFDSIPLFSV